MYLIPDDFSPERLKGKTIEQVCYSINQIGLFWENGNYGHEIEMYTVEQGEKRDKRQ